jgi:hypothetical protein
MLCRGWRYHWKRWLNEGQSKSIRMKIAGLSKCLWRGGTPYIEHQTDSTSIMTTLGRHEAAIDVDVPTNDRKRKSGPEA